MQVIAGLTPLAAAAFLVVVGPDQFTPSGFRRFRILLFVLLAAGVFASWLANWWATRLNQYVAVLTASKAK